MSADNINIVVLAAWLLKAKDILHISFRGALRQHDETAILPTGFIMFDAISLQEI